MAAGCPARHNAKPPVLIKSSNVACSMVCEEELMPLDAPMADRDPAPRRGTVDSFRLLTARLKRLEVPQPPPSPPVVVAEPPPPPSAAVVLPPAPPDPGEAASALLDIVWRGGPAAARAQHGRRYAAPAAAEAFGP